MKNKKNNFLVLSLLGLFCIGLWSCENGQHENAPDVSHINIDVKVERAEQKLLNAQSLEDVKEYLTAHPALVKSFRYPNTDILAQTLFKLAQDPYMDTLLHVSAEAVDTEALTAEYKKAFQYVKYYYPDFEVPIVYTMITGFQYDLQLTDEAILVGLDYYMGNRHSPFRPDVQSMPEYIWKRYDVNTIVPHTMRQLSGKFIAQNSEDRTLLNKMLTYGKSLYFMEQVLPTTPDSLIVGYTGQELVNAHGNLDFIWGHFVENQVFYDKTSVAESRYIKEAPFVNVISQKCPGRIGRWLGWQILRAYVEEKPQISLPDLLQETDAQKIFQESRFKPKPLE